MDEQHTDPNMAFERPEDTYEGKDFYAGEEPGAEEDYIDPALGAPVKPKSNIWITIGIFGGVAVFALVMAWVNFGSVLFPPANTAVNAPQNSAALLSPVTAPGQPAADATTATAPAPGAPVADNSAQPAMPIAAGTDPAAQPQPGAVAPATATPASGAPTDVAALSVTPGTPVTTPPPVVNPAAVPAQPVIATTAPGTGPIVMATDTPPITPQPAAGTPPAIPQPITVMPAIQPAPTGTGKVADLQQQNQDLTAKTAEQDATINDLKTQLADAQAKLADAEAKLNGQTAAPQTSKPRKVAKKPATHHAAVAKAAGDDADMPASTVPAKAASAGYLGGGTLPSPPPYWVLRSAAENSAWVAHPGDGQLYQITVGDQLPGVGKILSIQQQAGAWVVTGTQGQIRQP